MKITILGCGASAGVPLVGCTCGVCLSTNPKNKRTRVSLLLEVNETRILIDTSPDLHQQALRHDIRSVDAILFTHAHADHLHGIDDVRSFNFHREASIPAFGSVSTMQEIHERFRYAFLPPKPEYGWFRPCLTVETVVPGQKFTVKDVEILPFRQLHGQVDSLGFRVGNFVYSTDVKAFPEESEHHLRDIELWVLDCLTDERPMPTHADLDLVMEWVDHYKPQRTVLTHMSHALEYDDVNRRTPSSVEAAYDGMALTL